MGSRAACLEDGESAYCLEAKGEEAKGERLEAKGERLEAKGERRG